MGRNPLLNIAMECERIALEDDYFISRKLYPNVDFYTGLIYQSDGFSVQSCSWCFSLFLAPADGSRSGKRCCSTLVAAIARWRNLPGPRAAALRAFR